MSGQRKSYNEYEKQINEYLKEHSPYEQGEPLGVDLRALSCYLNEKGISRKDVTPEIVKKFLIDYQQT